MAKFELKLPKMGESVAEATLTTWLKEVGDEIEMDEAVFEIATDKVDSEVPSEVDGILVEKLFNVDDVVKVGQTVAIISTDGDSPEDVFVKEEVEEQVEAAVQEIEETIVVAKDAVQAPVLGQSSTNRFYSPLVKNIAKQEGLTIEELDAIPGTGKEGRVSKNDIINYVASRKTKNKNSEVVAEKVTVKSTAPSPVSKPLTNVDKPVVAEKTNKIENSSGHEVIEMSRMGKLIAKHMVDSVSTSAHVQSFIEVDVTNLVNWRNNVKKAFEEQEGEKLTFTPIFLEAVAKALKKYPLMNISVQGDTVIKKKNINIGMAAALPDGNLIVPVIKNADQLNLVGMAKVVNDLAVRSRNNALKPDEVQDGTYTVTNVGTFGSVFGTPIINQPQVGILALGAIRKIPSVIETSEGDYIGIRSKMYLSHSYDHRVVNGALGSMFVKAVADYLEAWDVNRDF
ncbi:2-oxoglutarate dehydrogenase E2 component (dihydrolipoamide succinyltransferase) [Maribacter vaceletii]|uniref:Dihydrolipoamide acetyltransferase component of pyruvate dehydrogenase complex n=1 Tax=Maribacter vaceletii TaxID=1206816 RepID=A0A495DSR5_9FLAO|nr:dihydrolipoamide acetyltransferase family protein [Maribacter vaceletii]RKR06517.1 2-oxoglutarate dehydrogenase E2 component (dihydrolipoamide succinyltransferase) [Maribacter vaceletii]